MLLCNAVKRPHHVAVQVLPISFFERCNNAYFNSVVIFDADGSRLGVYRKSHIPDGPGYQVRVNTTASLQFVCDVCVCMNNRLGGCMAGVEVSRERLSIRTVKGIDPSGTLFDLRKAYARAPLLKPILLRPRISFHRCTSVCFKQFRVYCGVLHASDISTYTADLVLLC